MNFYFACNHILENCSNIEEGIVVLKSFPSSVANNYLLAIHQEVWLWLKLHQIEVMFVCRKIIIFIV
ncbi:hypothetical protein [Bacillus toyonensis]|uniref:hypothetical protein n=1 Tax=Bacillus toyonensis TaxID=155322 RepID=UPI00352A8669